MLVHHILQRKKKTTSPTKRRLSLCHSVPTPALSSLCKAIFAWRNFRTAVDVESCMALALNSLSQSSLVTYPKYQTLLPSYSCFLVDFSSTFYGRLQSLFWYELNIGIGFGRVFFVFFTLFELYSRIKNIFFSERNATVLSPPSSSYMPFLMWQMDDVLSEPPYLIKR